jgi:hypothetical protein
MATTPDRLFVQTRHLGQQTISAMTDALGLQRHKPTALILVQPAEQHEHLPVQFTFRVVNTLLTQRALTDWDD